MGKERHSEESKEKVLGVLGRIENGETTLCGQPLDRDQPQDDPILEGDVQPPTQN